MICNPFNLRRSGGQSCVLCLMALLSCCNSFLLPRTNSIGTTTRTITTENTPLFVISPNQSPFLEGLIGSNSNLVDNRISSCITGSHLWISEIDFSATVSDGIRIFVFVVVGLIVILAAISTFVTQSVLPEQMENLSKLVAEENPKAFGEIMAKLEDGQNLKDRPDLMSAMVEIGVTLMKDEAQEEMDSLLQTLKDKKTEDGGGGKLDIETLREPIEASIGMTIEDFIDKAEKNPNSKYMTETKRELAELFKEEISTQ